MFVYLLMAGLLFSPSAGAKPQAAPVSVKVRVVLVDQDLNQKAVPFYVVDLRPEGDGNAPTELKTDLDGKSEKLLAPGRYIISSSKPIELGGKRYSWNLEIQIAGAERRNDLGAGIEHQKLHVEVLVFEIAAVLGDVERCIAGRAAGANRNAVGRSRRDRHGKHHAGQRCGRLHDARLPGGRFDPLCHGPAHQDRRLARLTGTSCGCAPP